MHDRLEVSEVKEETQFRTQGAGQYSWGAKRPCPAPRKARHGSVRPGKARPHSLQCLACKPHHDWHTKAIGLYRQKTDRVANRVPWPHGCSDLGTHGPDPQNGSQKRGTSVHRTADRRTPHARPPQDRCCCTGRQAVSRPMQTPQACLSNHCRSSATECATVFGPSRCRPSGSCAP